MVKMKMKMLCMIVIMSVFDGGIMVVMNLSIVFPFGPEASSRSCLSTLTPKYKSELKPLRILNLRIVSPAVLGGIKARISSSETWLKTYCNDQNQIAITMAVKHYTSHDA